MPSLQNSADLSAQDTLEKTKELQETLKIFEEDRINTFKNWPYDENQKCSITEMAKAGFYFSGATNDDDAATCFVCGKDLDGWESTDDPWIEHQKHSANCKFLQMRRSEDELTVEEFLDLFKHIIRQYISDKYRKKEADLTKRIEKIREMIKNHQF